MIARHVEVGLRLRRSLQRALGRRVRRGRGRRRGRTTCGFVGPRAVRGAARARGRRGPGLDRAPLGLLPRRSSAPIRRSATSSGSAPIIKRWIYRGSSRDASRSRRTSAVASRRSNCPTLVHRGQPMRTSTAACCRRPANKDLDDVSPDWRARWDPKRSPKHYDRTMPDGDGVRGDAQGARDPKAELVKELAAAWRVRSWRAPIRRIRIVVPGFEPPPGARLARQRGAHAVRGAARRDR